MYKIRHYLQDETFDPFATLLDFVRVWFLSSSGEERISNGNFNFRFLPLKGRLGAVVESPSQAAPETEDRVSICRCSEMEELFDSRHQSRFRLQPSFGLFDWSLVVYTGAVASP